jgi:serine/threonine protein phosphatase PrpC
MRVIFEVSCIVDKGNICKSNDDRAVVCRRIISEGYYEETGETVLAVVCDGVGGEAFGYEAAEITARHFSRLLNQTVTVQTIEQAINEANFLIVSSQKSGIAYAKMATTIAGIYLNDNDYIVFNVGDSKVFRYRPPYIAQISTEHSLARELRDLGLNPILGQEHVITRCLGGRDYTPDIVDGKGKLLDCDVFFVCTDGISDVISEIEIETILSETTSGKELCQRFIDVAKLKGSADNMSGIIIRRV